MDGKNVIKKLQFLFRFLKNTFWKNTIAFLNHITIIFEKLLKNAHNWKQL